MGEVATGRVLVIEDHPDLRLLLDWLLSLSGYEVVLAEGGPEALRWLAEVRLAPDLAILDVEMPDLSGWEVLRSIRGDPATADLPVIMCTVRGGPEDLDQGRRLGCDGYLQKPFDVDQLVAEVGDVIRRAGRQAPAGVVRRRRPPARVPRPVRVPRPGGCGEPRR
jgi:DNA-binding response OmpR family regulator